MSSASRAPQVLEGRERADDPGLKVLQVPVRRHCHIRGELQRVQARKVAELRQGGRAAAERRGGDASWVGSGGL